LDTGLEGDYEANQINTVSLHFLEGFEVEIDSHFSFLIIKLKRSGVFVMRRRVVQETKEIPIQDMKRLQMYL
jgi:hypothetical protein